MATQSLNSAEGWDATAEDYDSVNVKDINFTPKYAKDLFYYALTGNINSEEKQVIQSINLLSSAKFIDIAAGSGTLTLQVGRMLAKSNKLGASILGTDFSPKMVELLDKGVKSENLQSHIECKVMDGQALELSDNTLDFAFSVFGVFLFPQPLKGISEIYRVLKPGGVIGLTSWTPNFAIRELHVAALQKVVGTAPQVPFSLGTIEEMTAALKSEGFKDIRVQAVTHNAEFGDSEKYCKMMQSNPVLGQVKQKLGEEGWNKFKQEIDNLFKERYPSYALPCEALLAVATK